MHTTKTLAAAAAALAMTCPAWAINKCTGPDGKTTFQDVPCDSNATSSTVQIRSANVVAAQKPPPPASAEAQASAVPPPQPAAPPAKSELEQLADACLNWYRPMLRDPRGAYHRDAQLASGVLRLTIYATNGFGGYVSKPAACEIKSGRIDDGWTRIHAGRAKWPT